MERSAACRLPIDVFAHVMEYSDSQTRRNLARTCKDMYILSKQVPVEQGTVIWDIRCPFPIEKARCRHLTIQLQDCDPSRLSSLQRVRLPWVTKINWTSVNAIEFLNLSDLSRLAYFDLPQVTEVSFLLNHSSQIHDILSILVGPQLKRISINVNHVSFQNWNLAKMPQVDSLKVCCQQITTVAEPLFSKDLQQKVKHVEYNGHGIVFHHMLPHLRQLLQGLHELEGLESLKLQNMMDDSLWRVPLFLPCCLKLDLSSNRNLTLSRPVLDDLRIKWPNLKQLFLNQCNLTKHHFMNLESWLPLTDIHTIEINGNDAIDECIQLPMPMTFRKWQPKKVSMIETSLNREQQNLFFEKLDLVCLETIQVPVQDIFTIQRLLQAPHLKYVTLDCRCVDGSILQRFFQCLQGPFYYQRVTIILSYIQDLMQRSRFEMYWSTACPQAALVFQTSFDSLKENQS